MADPGWYHVDGDPPGTVRRWNGTEWIGFPVPNPLDPGAGREETPNLQLSRRGSVLSALTLVLLTAVAILLVFVASRLYRGIDALPGASIGPRTGAVVRIAQLGDFIDGLWVMTGATVVLVALALTAFSLWSRSAAAAAQIHRFSAPSKRSRRFERAAGRELPQARPVTGAYSMLLVVLFSATSGGKTSAHASRNLFARVSDTAMAASSDPQTGVARINPVKLVIWWALWWLPLIVGVFAWLLVWIMGPVAAETMQSVLFLTVVLLALEVVSLLCILAAVGQITSYLTK